jgi:hypothetical protein
MLSRKYVVHVLHVFLEDLFVQNSFPSGAMSAPLSSAPSHEPTKLQWPRVMTALLRSQYSASSLHVRKYHFHCGMTFLISLFGTHQNSKYIQQIGMFVSQEITPPNSMPALWSSGSSLRNRSKIYHVLVNEFALLSCCSLISYCQLKSYD